MCIRDRYYPAGAVQFFLNLHCEERINMAMEKEKIYLVFAGDYVVGTGSIREMCIRDRIIEGMNGSWKQGTQAVLIFKSDAAFADFISVLVDGTVVDGANYTVSEGSTMVTMKSAYLETLTVGTHTLTVRSQNGDASTQFTICLLYTSRCV